MTKPSRLPVEVRERAVRMVQEYPSLWARISSIAPKVGATRRRCACGCAGPRSTRVPGPGQDGAGGVDEPLGGAEVRHGKSHPAAEVGEARWRRGHVVTALPVVPPESEDPTGADDDDTVGPPEAVGAELEGLTDGVGRGRARMAIEPGPAIARGSHPTRCPRTVG